jgi:peptidyl-dipeptidase Dcp
VRLATRTYESFVRNGAALDTAQKAQLGQYNQQLATLFSDFSDKVLADESTYLAVTEAEMKGVPPT